MLFVFLLAGLLWITERTATGHGGVTKSISWRPKEKFRTTVIGWHNVVQSNVHGQNITHEGEIYEVYGDADNIFNFYTRYSFENCTLTQYSDDFTPSEMTLDMKWGFIATSVYNYSLTAQKFDSDEKFYMSEEKVNRDYELFLRDNRTGDIFVGNTALEANISNASGVWEAVGTLIFHQPFQMRKNYLKINYDVGQIIMEKLDIDDWEPFFNVSVGDYVASFASKVKVNLNYDPFADTYNAAIFRTPDQDHMYHGPSLEPLANLSIDDAKMTAVMPNASWNLIYRFQQRSVALQTREESITVRMDELTLKTGDKSLAVYYDESMDRVTTSCYRQYYTDGTVQLNVYSDGINMIFYKNLLTYNKTTNVITFESQVNRIVSKVTIDINNKTMVQIPIRSIQNFGYHDPTTYMSYEIQTGIKKSWINIVKAEKVDYIIIGDYFVDLRVSEVRMQLNRITGDVTTNFGNVNWNAGDSFTAECDDQRATVKPANKYGPKLAWMDANGEKISMNLSPDGVLNTFYTGLKTNFQDHSLHLHSNRDFATLRFNDMVAKITTKTKQTKENN